MENSNGLSIDSEKEHSFDVNLERSVERLCPSVVDRYFTKLYEVNLPKGYKEYQNTKISNFNDVCILRHSNRLCIITLAPSHPVIKNKATVSISKICYKVSERLDHSNNHVSGKRKRGAHWLNPTTPVCLITCSDGSQYTVYSGTRGSLVEINERLVADPSLLQKSPMTEGFIAIVMPKLAEASAMMDVLLTDDKYHDYVNKMEQVNP